MEIPGFHYDTVKKRYFKIERNGNIHSYTSSSLKHKREGDELKNSISKLKLDIKNKQPIIESQILSLKSKIFHQEIQRIGSYYQEYIISKLNSHEKKRIIPFESPPCNNTSKKMVINDQGSLFVCGNKGLYEFIELDAMTDSIIPESVFVDHSIKDSILRSMENTGTSMGIVRLWSGVLNNPSRLSLFKNNGEIYKCEFNNELLNASRFNTVTNKVTFVGDRKLRLWDSNCNKVLEVPSKGDCLSVDVHGPNSYLGYRNGNFKIWDVRKHKLNNIKKFSSSIMNISHISEFEVLISSFDDLFLWDLRNNSRIRKFNSLRSVSNPFEENFFAIGQLKKNGFILQNTKVIEFFRLNNEAPIKIISKTDYGAEEINCSVYDEQENMLFTICNNNSLVVTK